MGVHLVNPLGVVCSVAVGSFSSVIDWQPAANTSEGVGYDVFLCGVHGEIIKAFNRELALFYWSIGKDRLDRQRT